jgi:hypothetical protein
MFFQETQAWRGKKFQFGENGLKGCLLHWTIKSSPNHGNLWIEQGLRCKGIHTILDNK